MIKVSVIIPVYNVENYLREALNSVINQTLREIEIIIVNDGSIDSSFDIIKGYKERDSRIVMINQENKGLSEARNVGLRIALGKYIYFMDSDDYIELDTLKKCYEKCEKKKLDIVFFDAFAFSEEKIKINKNMYDRSNVLNENEILSGEKYLKKMLKNKVYKSAVVLNFIKLDYLKKIKLEFFKGIIHEDELFTFILFLYAKRVNYINRKFFKRRIRAGSIMTTIKGEKNIIGYLTVARELEKIRNKEKKIEQQKLINIGFQNIIGNAINILEFLDLDLKRDYKIEIKNTFIRNLSIKNKVKLYTPKVFKILKKFIR